MEHRANHSGICFTLKMGDSVIHNTVFKSILTYYRCINPFPKHDLFLITDTIIETLSVSSSIASCLKTNFFKRKPVESEKNSES